MYGSKKDPEKPKHLEKEIKSGGIILHDSNYIAAPLVIKAVYCWDKSRPSAMEQN